jgi:hypothetical protein
MFDLKAAGAEDGSAIRTARVIAIKPVRTRPEAASPDPRTSRPRITKSSVSIFPPITRALVAKQCGKVTAACGSRL